MTYKKACKICGKENSLFSLEFAANDEHDAYNVWVCGSCWEVIANIATKALIDRITKIENWILDTMKVVK